MSKLSAFKKLSLLSATALVGVGLIAFTSSTAMAACTPASPTAGATVTCTGTITNTLSVSTINNLTINVENGTTITTTSYPFNLGLNSTINLQSGSVVQHSGALGIRFKSGTLNIDQGASLLGVNSLFNIGDVNVNLKGTLGSIAFSNGFNTLSLYDTATFGSIAGYNSNAFGTDTLVLTGTAQGTFDTGLIGSTITDFDFFQKDGTGTWTLTGSNVQTWVVNGGTLIGTTNNFGDLIAVYDSNIVFDQSSDGTYSHNLTGSSTGNVIIRGGAIIEFDGTNTYAADTLVTGTGSTLKIDDDTRLGDASNTLILEDAGSLLLSTSVDVDHAIELRGTGGKVIAQNTSSVLNGTISGSGGLTLDGDSGGASFIELTGTNTYLGGTSIIGRAIAMISADENLGDATGRILFDNGTLEVYNNILSARDIYVTANGAIINLISSDFTTSGDIAGSGLIFLTGNGTLALTGHSTHTGGFYIDSGTLLGNADSLSGNDIENHDTLIFDQATNATFSNVITSTGNLIKKGTGTLILTANNSYTGQTDVDAGKLVINGNQQNTNVTVAAGATLGGGGQINNLNLLGTLTPGNSIGTLTTNGNALFGTGSTYRAEIDDAGNSDLLSVTGTTTINSGSNLYVDAATGNYTAGSLYTILNSTGTVTGTFSTVNSNLAFLTPTVLYGTHDIQLELVSNGNSFNVVAQNGVQQSVADSVQGLGSGNDLYDAFSGLTVSDAQHALDVLSNQNSAGLGGAVAEMSTVIRSALTNRMQTLAYQFDSSNIGALVSGSKVTFLANTSPAATEPAAGGDNQGGNQDYLYYGSGQSRIWSEVFGTDGKTNARGTSSRQDRGTYGMLAGIDNMIDDQSYIGLFAGYETGEINNYSQGASTTLDNYHMGAYATHLLDNGFKVNAGIGGTYHDIHSQRHISFGGLTESPEGNTQGFTTVSFVESSYALNTQNIALEPFAGMSFTYSHINGYTETNGGVTSLDVDNSNTFTPSHAVGVRAGKSFDTADGDLIRLGGMMGWQHAYGNLEDKTTMSFTGSSASFDTYGTGRARDSLLLGVGINANFSNDTELYAHYNGQLSQDSQDNVFSAGLRYKL